MKMPMHEYEPIKSMETSIAGDLIVIDIQDQTVDCNEFFLFKVQTLTDALLLEHIHSWFTAIFIEKAESGYLVKVVSPYPELDIL